MPAVPGTVSRTIAAIVEVPREHGLLEVLERPLRLLLLVRGVEGRAVEERAEEVHDPRAPVVVGPAPRLAGQVGRRRRAPVVRAVPGEQLDPARVEPGHAGGVLDGLRSCVGEKDLVHACGSELADQPGGLAATPRSACNGRDRAKSVRLRLDGRDDLRVLVADVGVDELTREVEVALAVVVPDVGALRRRRSPSA